MMLKREWVTPIAAGAFLLSAVTGVVMFFHADTGLNKLAHEWLGWVLLGAVALHVSVNFAGFKRHLSSGRGRLLIGAFALALVVSFVPLGKQSSEPAFAPPVRALAQAPLSTLAVVARLSPEQLRQRLAKAGVQPKSDQQSLSELVGPELRAQMRVLGPLFAQGG